MAHVFISYRRDDAGYVAGMLAERISSAFGAGSLFIDVDTIPLGVDFRTHINDAVAQCDVLLAIIGDSWLAKSPDSSQRRIDDTTDFVRIELEAALARNIPVIPVLIDSAKMPSPQDLPPALEALAFRNATELRPGRDMKHHIDVLIDGLRVHLAADEEPAKYPPTGKQKGAFHKEWIASFQGKQIKVTNWWTFSGKSEAKLYIDGNCVDTSKQVAKASLRGTVQDQAGSDRRVEVLFGGLVTLKAKVLVDGEQIGGDSF